MKYLAAIFRTKNDDIPKKLYTIAIDILAGLISNVFIFKNLINKLTEQLRYSY